ncbi:helix-turn-helix domain-containing protein [Actinomadura opuntiae]|uniref:helix-turn-helix domain-containing protein n=1 Tax=Actinomadura sp. OS1-43 TaxID=604315 RepID=UPI00255B2BE4|nr:helix-turn-helix domain-containing protein [Actinomadura sp. OS1-43]MDL4812741.1 helix-turn-helix domain-containing protein [Actinomadura sp. OS1-43]
MVDVKSARKAYEEAQDEARLVIQRARHRLGEAIRNARLENVPQETIAKELGLTREQVRRFQRDYEDANGLERLR